MRNGHNDRTETLGDKRYDNVEDYLSGLRAAIRTHQRLTGGKALRVELDTAGRLPLAQAIMLR